MLVKDTYETVKPSEHGASKPPSTYTSLGLIRQCRAYRHPGKTALNERRAILVGSAVRAVVGGKMEMRGKWMNRGLVA